MQLIAQEQKSRLQKTIQDYLTAFPASKTNLARKIVSQVDLLSTDSEGMWVIYDCIPDLIQSGFFTDTIWENPRNLVPGLVKGTLLSTYPTNIYELLSELRFMALAESKIELTDFSAEEALLFLKEVIVHNFDIAFGEVEPTAPESGEESMQKKSRLLFDFLLDKIPVYTLKEHLLREVESTIAQRPIVTERVEGILRLLHYEFDLKENIPADWALIEYCNILFRHLPSALEEQLPKWSEDKLEKEARTAGALMRKSGLVAPYHLTFLKMVARNHPEYIPDLLELNLHGRAEFNRFREFITLLIEEYLVPANKQAIFGLARVLERNLLSKKPVFHAINRLVRINLHPAVEERLSRGKKKDEPATPRQLLIGGVLSLLGQPLGVRQGNNPTCQSARALSMWSRHAPAKLINLIVDVAYSDNLIFRFNNTLIQSNQQGGQVGEKFDYRLDAASVVLVPHLDRIYGEMMRQASLYYPGKDPHIYVNPAFYGHWIQTGFMAVYNPITGRIEDYERFVATFFAAFHPEYNDGHDLVYPVPLGIYITDARAHMQGFHAISLTRVRQDPAGIWRAYFFNPNSEGPQNWGQEIRPSVRDQGEWAGESSLPFYQLASRVYAFHYNQLQLGNKTELVPKEKVEQVRELAKSSWGKKYQWDS